MWVKVIGNSFYPRQKNNVYEKQKDLLNILKILVLYRLEWVKIIFFNN
ncbi:MAG: hypothetical protein PWP68_887 [Rikenellaceae bacterium]|jgi:hypothetical protein|nr:hypothetical protein [Rikenellaceae bacterium]